MITKWSYIILSLFGVSLLRAQQWQIVNPLPWSNTSSSIFFIDSLTGWIAGNGGNILRTTDGGQKWKPLNTESKASLLDIFFVNERVGWAVGEISGRINVIPGTPPILIQDRYGTVEKTSDGGLTWTTLRVPLLRDATVPGFVYYTFVKVQFVSELHGFVLMNRGYICRTRDGGLTWSVHEVDTTAFHYSMTFISQEIGYIATNKGIYKTIDSGSSWQKVSDLPGTSVTFRNETNGWLGGSYLWRTTNGGMEWSVADSSLKGNVKVFFLDTTSAWASTSNGFFKTTDGGYTWNKIMDFSLGPISHFVFLSAQVGLATGSFGSLFRSEDGGVTWMDKKIDLIGGNLPFVTDIHSIKDDHVWITTTSQNARRELLSQILYSSNKGNTWTTQFSDAGSWFSDVYFIDSLRGIVAGRNGAFLLTTNGGRDWVKRSMGANGNLDAISFTDRLNGWLVEQATSTNIYRTRNAGELWTLQGSLSIQGLNSSLSKIFFSDSLNGWAVGGDQATEEGFIFRTSDGGKTWAQQFRRQVGFLADLFFIDSLKGWVVGSGVGYKYNISEGDGAILRTTDGGVTWQFQRRPIDEVFGYESVISLKSIFFVNESKGWAAGSPGAIIHTKDGGTTWMVQPSKSSFGDLRLFMTKEDEGWAVGDIGTILRYSSGGLTMINDWGVNPKVKPKQSFSASLCYPNPFNTYTRVEIIALSGDGSFRLRIYDVLGREVYTEQKQGRQNEKISFVWDGTNLSNGTIMPSGVYWLLIENEVEKQVKKLVLVR